MSNDTLPSANVTSAAHLSRICTIAVQIMNFMSCKANEGDRNPGPLTFELGRVTDEQGTARFWVMLQANYDLSRAMKRKQPPVQSLLA
jgi:hypothetical protein